MDTIQEMRDKATDALLRAQAEAELAEHEVRKWERMLEWVDEKERGADHAPSS